MHRTVKQEIRANYLSVGHQFEYVDVVAGRNVVVFFLISVFNCQSVHAHYVICQQFRRI